MEKTSLKKINKYVAWLLTIIVATYMLTGLAITGQFGLQDYSALYSGHTAFKHPAVGTACGGLGGACGILHPLKA